MNNDLNIAKGLSTEVRAILDDSGEICGSFFLADHAPNHYGDETLLDLLNHSGKQFVPFDQCDGLPLVLVQKAKILGLRPKYSNSQQWPRMDNDDESCWAQAKVVFAEFSLEGRVFTGDMQPERRRLADLLNHENLFFMFETEEEPWIINKNLMNYLEPLA